MNNKYNNSVIYIIKCKDETIKDCYIGSTINFKNRKKNHKSDCYNEKCKSFNYKVYKFIRDNGGTDNFYFDILKNVNCNNKQELHKLEGEYIKLYTPSLNSQAAHTLYYVNRKEYDKKYYIDNKDYILKVHNKWKKNNKDKIKEHNKEYNKKNKEYRKEYYEKNKDTINEKRKIKMTCECGSIVRKSDIACHKKQKNILTI